MILLASSDQNEIVPEDLPLPASMRQYLVPSVTEWSYRHYSFGYTLSQTIICPGVRIHRYHFTAKEVTAFWAYFPEPTIALQFMTKGSVEALLQNLQTLLEPAKCGLFFLPESMNEVILAKGFSSSIHFELSQEYAGDLAKAHPAIKDLMDKLYSKSEKAERLEPIPVDHEITSFLDRLYILPSDNQDMLERNIKIIILSLLNIYGTRLSAKEKLESLPYTKYKDKIITIGDSITRDPKMRQYSLAKLSTEYNIPVHALKTGFRSIWGTTLSNFIVKKCMEKAEFLRIEKKMGVTTIAEEIGYDNASNFTRAYRRYYGKPFGKNRGD